uniref:Protein kinase domain-containing protein n=1 Tax=Echinococcus granulosus TaxID=6210 RepID=A0A068WXX8_ECHGR|nr:hypothetical protein EgrG_001171000 [Echinococcus granulosus]
MDCWEPKTLLLNVERNPSPANNCTDVTSSKSETLDDAQCRSIVNSPPPSPKSSSNLRGPSKSKTSPCCKIAPTSRKSNIDVLQMRPAKPTKKLSQTDVEKMYVEFIRASERSRPRHKAFTGLEDSEVTKAKSPVREPFHRAFDSRDCATSTDFHGQQSPRTANPAEDHAFTLYTACHCSPCGTPSPPTPSHPEGRSCACVHLCGSNTFCSCHGFQLSCACNYNIGEAYNANRVHPFLSHNCCHHNHHHRGHHNWHQPSCPSCPPHTALCQEGVNPHYNNSYFSARDGFSVATNQPQPSNTKEPPPTSLQTKVMSLPGAQEHPVRESTAPSHCSQSGTWEKFPPSASTTLSSAANPIHSINNSVFKASGCSWFEFAPRSHLKGAGATNTKRQSLEREQISKSTHWRPAFRDYSHDATVRFNFSRTNPPYACDREEDFNQRNGSNVDPQSLQEAFRLRMKAFIARSEARQRFIRLNALERRLRAKHGAMRSMNNCNTVLPDKEMGLRAGTSCLRLPNYLRCPRFLSTIGQTAYSATRPKKLKKSNRKLLAPYEAHRLFQVQKKSNLFTNRARMKQYSETIRKRLLKSVHNL